MAKQTHASDKYHQFCPISTAAEVLANRWTFLVVRELLCGSTRFNELRHGVPLMSQSLLSTRLDELEAAHIIKIDGDGTARGKRYRLTAAGEALRPIVEMMGLWAQDWLRRDIKTDELDSGMLMWDVRRTVDSFALDEEDLVTIYFEFSHVGRGARRYWILNQNGDADLCVKDPGHEIDLYVYGTLRTVTEIWMGERDLKKAIADGKLRLEGRKDLIKKFSNWFVLNAFANDETKKRFSLMHS